MANKKVAKKATTKSSLTCSSGNTCYCQGILALIIVVLTWWKPAETWAQITITILAALILLSGSNCCCKK